MATANKAPLTDDRMTIQVLYFGLVRNIVNDAEETVTLPAGATVRDLLDSLCKKHGEALRDVLFTVEGTLIANAIILLDGTNIFYTNGLDTEIDSQQSLHVLLTTTAMAGG
ncbi:MAG: MoaD/ThiS family protein [Candidatus Binatia bacterium]